MKKESLLAEINSAIYGLKHFNKEIKDMVDWDDEVGAFMRGQAQYAKEQLVKKLITELVNSDISFSEIERILSRLTKYLSMQKSGESLAPDIQPHLQEVEQLLAA